MNYPNQHAQQLELKFEEQSKVIQQIGQKLPQVVNVPVFEEVKRAVQNN
jgi:hypothetical protein